MDTDDKQSAYGTIEAACRCAFDEEGYGYPESNMAKYRVFRDGFLAGWLASQKTAAATVKNDD